MYGMQFLGTLVLAPVVAISAAGLGRRRLAIAVSATTMVKLVAERAVRRLLVKRGRPGIIIGGAVVRSNESAVGLGFVSGHVALTSGIAWAVTPYLRSGWRSAPWGGVLLVALSRIYLGAHSPLDLIGGAGLGLAAGGIANLVVGIDSDART